MKKLLAMLVVVLGVSTLFATECKLFDHGRWWTLSSSSVAVSGESIERWTITGCDPLPEGEFTVPAKIQNISVWGVANEAFSGATNVTSVTVEPGIKKLGYAFYTEDVNKTVLPSNIEKVSLPEGLEYIDCDVFQNSKIENEQASNGFVVNGYLIKYTGTNETYTIPAGVKHICVTAFYRANTNSSVCVLKNIVIPEGVETIQEGAFDRLSCSPFVFGDVVLPDSLKSIGKNAFKNVSFKSLKLGKGITDLKKVGVDINGKDVAFKGAFNNVTIESLDFGNGVESIPGDLFMMDSALKSVKFGSALRAIGSAAFNRSSVTNFDFSAAAKLEVIGENAFSDNISTLETVDLSACKKLSSARNAFQSCRKLKSVKLPADGCLREISAGMFQACSALERVTIPASVVLIDENAFYDCAALTNVVFNEGLETIDSYAFQNCTALTSVELPSTVTCVGYYSFALCSQLATVKFNEGLEEIDDSAFVGCVALTSVELPSTVKRIGYYAFSGCAQLATLKLNEGLEEIDAFAFTDCSELTEVNIPDTVTDVYASYSGFNLGTKLFDNCKKLTKVTGGNGIENYSVEYGSILGDCPFTYCGEKDPEDNPYPGFEIVRFGKFILGCRGTCPANYTLDASKIGDAKFIGSAAFEQTYNQSLSNIVKVVIPETVRVIDEYAFCRDSGLKTLDLSAASPELEICKQSFLDSGVEEVKGVVSRIGLGAFQSCKNLKDVDVDVEPVAVPYEDDPESVNYYHNGYVDEGVFSDCTSLTNASVVVAASVADVEDDQIFMDFGTIGRDLFDGCENIKEVNIAARHLGDNMFSGCPAIEKATVNAENIPDKFMVGNTNLTELALGDLVGKIGWKAFEDCWSLTKLDLPETVAYLGVEAFNSCSNLAEVTGGEGLVCVDEFAFRGTKWWENAPDGATKLGTMLIRWTGTKEGETVDIPEDVTAIASSAFYSNLLAKVVIPSSVGTVYHRTFESCPNLELIECKSSGIRLETGYGLQDHIAYLCDKLGTNPLKFVVVPSQDGHIQNGWSDKTYVDENEFCRGYYYVVAAFEKLRFHNDEAEDGDFVPGSSYTGWIMSGNYVVGTVSVKTGKPDRNNEVKVTMTVQLAGVKKNFTAMFKVDENGKAVATEAARKQFSELAGNPAGRYDGMFLGGTWLSGGVRLAGRDYKVRGANSSKEALASMDAFANHTWGAVLVSSSDLVPVVNGYSGLSISVAKKGKVKISGTLADGQKVSVTAQMAAGDNGVFAAPVYVQTNSKKGGFGFVIDFYMDGESPRAWFEKYDDGVGYMTNWQYPLEFGVHNADSDASTFTSVDLYPVGSKELFEIDPKGNGLEKGLYFVRWDPNDYPEDSSAEAEHALNVSSKSPFVVIEQDSRFFDQFIDLMVDEKGKWTLPKATKVSLATEKDLEKYAEEISKAYVWTDRDLMGNERPHCTVVTSDGKILEAYDFYRDEIIRTYTPTAFLICDIGSKVNRDGEVILGTNTNFYDMKLSYAKKTGLVKGSSVYYWVDISKADKPALKKGKATVSGVVLDGKIYGASTVKKVASIALASEKAN